MKLVPLILVHFLIAFMTHAAEVITADVCIYGGTSGGLAAAVQVKRMGQKAVVAEFGRHLGGLSSGGLGATDIGNKSAIGGIAREFYLRVGKHYGEAEAWKFEPHVAEKIFHDIVKEAGVPVYYGQRLAMVTMNGRRITEITMDNGTVFRARMFIDATYEGDLMARAGVAYTVGREANSQYGETLNGVRAQTPAHQFRVAVDPYVQPGDPASGLLPLIQEGNGGPPGTADAKVQAYNYRLCFTTNATNRLPVIPPSNYDPARFELLGRYLEALVKSGLKPKLSEFWNPIWMPNQKTDINNNGGFSTDFIGANYNYPEADYATRARIAREHEDYTRGFITYLATEPRVPPNMRAEMQSWGPCRDEFPDTGGWPRQLYVREARRMVSDYVMTEHNCRGTKLAQDSVGLGAYNMDSHNCQRIVKNGRVENEGDVQVSVRPYPISFRSLIPKSTECVNLAVPVCLAATHIAYGSIRMEPVFMILGQSAATAAVMANEDGVPISEVNYQKLRTRLLADRQVLAWTGPAGPASIDPATMPGLVIDDSSGEKQGEWVVSAAAQARLVGTGYIHDNNADKGGISITYRPTITTADTYEVFLLSPPHANRATNVPVTINVMGKPAETVLVNQRMASHRGRALLGKWVFPAGTNSVVVVSNGGTDGYVVADGIQFLRVR